MAHAAAQNLVDRHIQIWESQGGTLMFFCPGDAVVKTEYPVIAYGRKSHHDAMANRRFKWLFAFLARYTLADWYLIDEGDSFCAIPQIPDLQSGCLWATAWKNDDPKFIGKHFLHPPLYMDRDTLLKANDALQKLPDESELGFWDRMLGLACDRYQVEWRGYLSLSFSRNTIEDTDIDAAVAAKRQGAVFFHGVKSRKAFEALMLV